MIHISLGSVQHVASCCVVQYMGRLIVSKWASLYFTPLFTVVWLSVFNFRYSCLFSTIVQGVTNVTCIIGYILLALWTTNNNIARRMHASDFFLIFSRLSSTKMTWWLRERSTQLTIALAKMLKYTWTCSPVGSIWIL